MIDQDPAESGSSPPAHSEPLGILLGALSLASRAPTPAIKQVIAADSADLQIVLAHRLSRSQPELAAALAEFTRDPGAYRSTAEEVLREVGADRDPEVLQRAVRLIQRAETVAPGISGGLIGQINSAGGPVIIVGGDVKGTINTGPLLSAPQPTNTPERENRVRMLRRVRDNWIDGYLKDSLDGASVQTLGLVERSDLARDNRQPSLGRLHGRGHSLAPTTSVVAAFDAFDRELLIVGEPGAGKTTVLLELTRTLLDRAEQDDALPMPVVFPLAHWAAERLPLEQWLVRELNTLYDVQPGIGRVWVNNDRILPVLDGLDEVAPEHRAACVIQINAFRQHQTRDLLGLVVTCRIAEYELLSARLSVRGAVLLQPFTAEQVQQYLAQAGVGVAGVRAALDADSTLRELAASPLLLHTLTLAYDGTGFDALPSRGSVDERRAHLLTAYVDSMLKRSSFRRTRDQYTRDQTLHWLGWLATTLTQHNQSIFHLEQLQPEWLPNRKLVGQYVVLDRLLIGVLAGVCLGAVAAAFGTVADGLTYAAATMLVVGLFGGVAAPGGRRNAFRGMRDAVLGWLAVGPIVGLVGAILVTTGVAPEVQSALRAAIADPAPLRLMRQDDPNAMPVEDVMHLIEVLTSPASLALIIWVMEAALFGISGALAGVLAGTPSVRPRRIAPVESLQWSLANAVSAGIRGIVLGMVLAFLLGLSFGVLFGSAASLVFGGSTNVVFWLAFALLLTPIFMLFLGAVFAIPLGVVGGLVARHLANTATPNQGIHRSARYAVLVGMAGSLLYALLLHLAITVQLPVAAGLLGGAAPSHAPLSLQDYLPGLLLVALTIGLPVGGFACLSHLALRLTLWRAGCMPLNYVQFLDDATQRIFLRRVGGGYTFTHRLIQEYFVTLWWGMAPRGGKAK